MPTKHAYIKNLAHMAGNFLGELGKSATAAFLKDDPSIRVSVTISQGEDHMHLHHDERVDDFAYDGPPPRSPGELRMRAQAQSALRGPGKVNKTLELEGAVQTPSAKSTKKKKASSLSNK